MSLAQLCKFSLDEVLNGRRPDELRASIEAGHPIYLTDHGLTQSDHEEVVHSGMDFFIHGSVGEKEAVCNSSRSCRGYSALDSESTAAAVGIGEFGDHAMVFSMGMDGNVFPNSPFRRTWEEYYGKMNAVAVAVSQAFLETLGIPHEEASAASRSEAVLRFRYWPAVGEDRWVRATQLRRRFVQRA